MQLAQFDTDEGNAAAVASTLIRTFREVAPSLVDEQVAKCADNPEIASRWEAIAKAIRAINQANVHMEMALEMLDSVEERHASIHLDHAIVTLGVRDDKSLADDQHSLLG